MNYHTYVIFLLVTYSASTSAFFLSWGSPTPATVNNNKLAPPPQTQWPTIAYYQRVSNMQQPQYVDNNGVPVQIPAIPIQAPLQAQMSPASAIHNVQLVPCLCPVAQDMEYVENVPAQPTNQQQVPQPVQQQPQQQTKK